MNWIFAFWWQFARGPTANRADAHGRGRYYLSMSDVAEEDDRADANRRTMEDVFRIWINPEVERRQEAGLVTTPFPLEKAQVVLNVDQPVQIRLNDEVKAIMKVDLQEESKRDLKRGQPVLWDMVKSIVDVQLTDEDPNAAHITMIAILGRGWWMHFDFRYNTARVRDTIEAAEQFLAAAEFAGGQAHRRAFAENLFAATASSLALLNLGGGEQRPTRPPPRRQRSWS